MDEVISEFLVESYENLDRMDSDLLELEQDPNARETISSIFRTIHTIKGTCGFLGFNRLESVAHAGENLLSLLRDGALSITPEIASALLAMGDAVREILANIEATGEEGEGDYTALTATLKRLQQGPATGQADADAEAEAPAPDLSVEAVDEQPTAPADAGDPPSDDEGRLGDILVHRGLAEADDVAIAAAQQELGDPRHLGEIMVGHGSVQPGDVAEALNAQNVNRKSSVADTSIRVDVSLLDQLMNLVGELVLARNQILQLTGEHADQALLAPSQRLNLITSELQEGVMKTRMQPIGNVWNKFPRIVRDLSMQTGKQVRVDMEGVDTELDKTIIEAIKDPLTHLIRNSVDHGIETPDVRTAKGKGREGRLLLRAFHEGGQVNIEITDDGAGIDVEKVKRKAVERGLVTPDQALRMGEREASGLIFLPGFSTAEKVTQISGRGVGMDVVKTNIEKIGGTVDVSTELGHGTTFKVKIPLTLAIIPALTVTTAGDRYAIPQISLLELVRLEGEQARRGIERIHGAPVYRLRGRLLPLVNLNDELGVSDECQSPEGVCNIVVLQADDQQFGLVVDDINDTQEIVVKPLSKQLKDVAAFAGATIMGDGKVALILDVLGIAQRAHVLSEVRDRGLLEGAAEATTTESDRQTLLLLGVGEDRRVAIPLSAVARLEEFQANKVERAGHREVTQYRGEILPLVRLAEVLGIGGYYGEESGQGTLNVVVYSHNGRRVGLVVGKILDIVEETVQPAEGGHARPGLLGSAVISGRVTDLIDVGETVRAADPDLLEPVDPALVGA